MKYRFFLSSFKIKKLPFMQFICGMIGHSFDGDWGYGGGEYADVWCRHCNKFTQIPKTSVWFTRRESKGMMDMVGKATKNV